jgi:hypothetical protein
VLAKQDSARIEGSLQSDGINRQKPNKQAENVSKSMEPVKQKKTPQQQLHTENEIAESGSDYDHDDFEKDEIVKMAEPSGTKKRKNMAERQTKESSHGENGSDNNSLLREISARNKLEAVKGSSSMPPTGKLI